jgi:hypothetical protein
MKVKKTDIAPKKTTVKKAVKKKTKEVGSKSTMIEFNRRISFVAEMIIKGYNKENIVRYSSENWKVTERQTEKYIAKAHEQFVNEAKAKDIDYHLNLALQQLQDLYKKSYAIQDYAECRRIKKDIADYLGFAAAKKVDVTSGGEKIITPWIIGTKNEGE